MAKYVYPAIFREEECGYTVSFPDIEHCFTEGTSLVDAMDMASDVLSLTLYMHETKGKTIPKPSTVFQIADTCADSEFVSLVFCDTLDYYKLNNKAVKKTLSIPAWLNEMAERKGLPFSVILQVALKKELGLEE